VIDPGKRVQLFFPCYPVFLVNTWDFLTVEATTKTRRHEGRYRI